MSPKKPGTLLLLLITSFLCSNHSAHAETSFLGGALSLKAAQTATPFQNDNGATPPKESYSGTMFVLSHDWPKTASPLPSGAPWQKAIGNGKITIANASAYADALKKAVSENGSKLISDYPSWDAAKAEWYNEPWTGSLREKIHGTYPAGLFRPSIFPDTGLTVSFKTHVLTYYDKRAAYSLQKIWGTDAKTPTLTTEATQFEEGSIIVKAAIFTSADPKKKTDWWDAMKGAQEWDLYVPVDSNNGPPQVWPGYVAQFDIIVKDTKSSPKTGWVFMTLVYDATAQGSVWDKMVPLGVQWGNDPQATQDTDPLVENWINPKAPKYATQTLGWGGRLSGPNDGARNDIAIVGSTPGLPFMPNAMNSSCMSCHSTAQWNVKKHKMVSFLLPSFPDPNKPDAFYANCTDRSQYDFNGDYICSPAPGSQTWMKWFQNRRGNQPMDAGSVAADFDEVLTFKSLPLWYAATYPKTAGEKFFLKTTQHGAEYNQYTGAPIPKQ